MDTPRALIGLGLFAIGVFAAIQAVVQRRRLLVARTWPTTSGRILASEIEVRTGAGDGRW